MYILNENLNIYLSIIQLNKNYEFNQKNHIAVKAPPISITNIVIQLIFEILNHKSILLLSLFISDQVTPATIRVTKISVK